MKYFEIHLVEHCNLNCQCCDNYSPLAEEEYLSKESFERDFIRMSGLFPEVNMIRLLGGEPLLHPEINFFLSTSRKYFPNAKILVTTNAILLEKMSEDFWKCCNENNITIEYTFYPINLNRDKHRELADRYNVSLIPFLNDYTENKLSWRTPVYTERKGNPSENYHNCARAKNCITLRKGKLYPCTCIPNIHHLNKFFGKKIEVTKKDSIDIYSHTTEEIDEFLNNPVPFCGYCNIKGSNNNKLWKQIPWAQTKYDESEWIDKEEDIIVSMTTIPCRKNRLEENIDSLLNQTYRKFKLVINIDDNLPDEDIAWYNEFSKRDKRIKIGFGESKWRSCNKLLPTLKDNQESVIITVDDDIYYPEECIERLIRKHEEYPNCIIAHEVQPLIVDRENKSVFYHNGFDVMLEQVEYGKYMSVCALYPKHCFDGTDLFDYDKMMQCTNGTHDELWFWINSTLNHVKVVGLSYIYTFIPEVRSQFGKDEYRLADINNDNSKLIEYKNTIDKLYGEKLYNIVTSEIPEFYVNSSNVQLFICLYSSIVQLYNYGFRLNFDKNVTTAWRSMILNLYNQR